jgi:hypothetical protein
MDLSAIRIPSDWSETLLAMYRADPDLASRVAARAWPKVLTIGGNAKLLKSTTKGVLTAGVQLSPATESGVNFCFDATKACAAACLGHSAGRMRFTASKRARLLRSIRLLTVPEDFMRALGGELDALIRKAERESLIAACRPNTTSDLPWERIAPELFELPVHFYDYTKSRRRMRAYLAGKLPQNYHLTYSYTGTDASWQAASSFLNAGATVAVVFGIPLPCRWRGFPVIDGDEHDARMIGENGVIVGLKAKGAAVKDHSGFVVRDEA